MHHNLTKMRHSQQQQQQHQHQPPAMFTPPGMPNMLPTPGSAAGSLSPPYFSASSPPSQVHHQPLAPMPNQPQPAAAEQANAAAAAVARQQQQLFLGQTQQQQHMMQQFSPLSPQQLTQPQPMHMYQQPPPQQPSYFLQQQAYQPFSRNSMAIPQTSMLSPSTATATVPPTPALCSPQHPAGPPGSPSTTVGGTRKGTSLYSFRDHVAHAFTDGNAMKTTLDVMDVNTSRLLTVPRDDLYSVPANRLPRQLRLCCDFDPTDPDDSCKYGPNCRWLHADTTRAEAKKVHVNWEYYQLEECPYPRLEEGAGIMLDIREPVSAGSELVDKVDSRCIIKTRCVFNDSSRPAHHCAHFYYGRECRKGGKCDFAHVAFINNAAKPESEGSTPNFLFRRRAPAPSVLGRSRYATEAAAAQRQFGHNTKDMKKTKTKEQQQPQDETTLLQQSPHGSAANPYLQQQQQQQQNATTGTGTGNTGAMSPPHMMSPQSDRGLAPPDFTLDAGACTGGQTMVHQQETSMLSPPSSSVPPISPQLMQQQQQQSAPLPSQQQQNAALPPPGSASQPPISPQALQLVDTVDVDQKGNWRHNPYSKAVTSTVTSPTNEALALRQ